MRQSSKNELFNFFYDKHDLLLTGSEIDAILNFVNKDEKSQKREIEYKINKYRVINAVILGLLSFLIPYIGIYYVVWLFISYNLIHVLIYSIKEKRYALRSHRMERKK